MISTQDILYAVTGQSLILDCPDGRPSSVTSVTVYEASADDTSQAETATTGSGAVETNPNTTVDVASGASESDPRKLYVTATTGCTVGRQYLLASGLGHNEWVEAADISSGDYVLLKHPLMNDYEVTASTLKSTRCSIGLDSTWVADQSNVSPAFAPNPRYRVRWVVPVGGVTKVYDRYFDLVRYAAQHGVTPLDVEDAHAGWLDALGPDDRKDQGRSVIEQAFNAVKFELYGDNKADQAIRNAELLAELVIEKTVQITVERQPNATAQQIATAERNFRQRYDQLLRAPVAPVDTTGGGGAATVRPTPLWSR